MKDKKKFDCVEMKWKIQKKIQKEFKDMSPDEARKEKRKQIDKDPILGNFVKQIKVIKDRIKS